MIRPFAVVLALAWPAGLLAEEVRVQLTVEGALEMAERYNPDLAAARALQDAAEADAEGASRTLWPRVGVSADVTRTDNPALVFMQKMNRGDFTAEDFAVDRLNDPDALGHLSTALALEVPIDLGRARAGSHAAQAQARAAAAGAGEARSGLRLQVIEVYRQAAVARRAVEATARSLDAARAAEEAMAARVKEGTALSADLLRLRARRRQREADLAGRQGDRNVAEGRLARTLGAETGTRYDLVDAEAPSAAPSPEELGAWVERALAHRASVTAGEARRDAARLLATAESHALRPDLAVYGRLQDDRWTDGGATSGTLGAVVRWAPFDATRSRRQAAAKARERAAENAARAVRDAVRVEVEGAFWRARAARERYAAAAGGAEEGREALRIVRERRESGLATLTDELEMEAASLQAELSEIAAASEAALADAALRRAAGEL